MGWRAGWGRLLGGVCLVLAGVGAAGAAPPQVTVLYDAFGDDGAMRKDWGFAALVEAGGRRILFDTGNDAAVFAHNVAAKGIDLETLDFVVMSHRHADHMAGLATVLDANPDVTVYAPQEGFGIYGSSLPSSFYRSAPELPARMRYYDGAPDDVLHFGSAWPDAEFRPLAQTTQIAPGVWAIAQVSDAPGTRELRELSLAIATEQGLVVLVGCSHPGIGTILAEAATLHDRLHLVMGGFHFVTAGDAAIAALVEDLRRYDIDFIAPGHCTGEPAFAALLAEYGERYLYAGVGATLRFDHARALRQRPHGADALARQRADGYRTRSLRGRPHADHDGPAHMAHAHATAAGDRQWAPSGR